MALVPSQHLEIDVLVPPRPSPLPFFSLPPSQFCVQALLHEPWSAPRFHHHPSRIRPVQLHGGQPSTASRCVGWHTHVRVILGGLALFPLLSGRCAGRHAQCVCVWTLRRLPPVHLYVGVSAPLLIVFRGTASLYWVLSPLPPGARLLFDFQDTRVRYYRQGFAALPTVDADCFRQLFTLLSPKNVVSIVRGAHRAHPIPHITPWSMCCSMRTSLGSAACVFSPSLTIWPFPCHTHVGRAATGF